MLNCRCFVVSINCNFGKKWTYFHSALWQGFSNLPSSITPDSTHQLISGDCKTWIGCLIKETYTMCRGGVLQDRFDNPCPIPHIQEDLWALIVFCVYLRCFGGPGCVRGAGSRLRSSAVWLHAGAGRHLHHLSVLVPHALPVCHTLRERRGGGRLLLLRGHQGHLPASAVGARR